ncbi:MAG: hypothetical protein HEEMFOPI_00506 [Holosporales bacterium]
MIYELIGKKIKLKRQSLNLTQEKVANFLGVSVQQYQKYENLVNKIPVHKLITLAELFEVSPCYFFRGCKSLEKTLLKEEKSSLKMNDDDIDDVIDTMLKIKSPHLKKKIVNLVKVIAIEDQSLIENKYQ